MMESIGINVNKTNKGMVDRCNHEEDEGND